MARLDAEVLSPCEVVEGMDEDAEIHLVSPCHGTCFHRCRLLFSAPSRSRSWIALVGRTQQSANNSIFKNYLRQRLSRRMCDAERHTLHSQLLCNFRRLTRYCQRGTSARLAHHFQIHPSHAAPPASS